LGRVKVAFFADILVDDFDGAARTMFQLINRIDCNRFHYLFIYGTGPDKLLGFDSLKVPSLPLPINHGYNIALPILAQKTITHTLQQFNPQVIHIATPSFLGNFGLDYANSHAIPVISIYHTHFIAYVDYYLKHAPMFIRGIKHRIIKGHKRFYNRCDKVYVPSQTIKDELYEMGVSNTKMDIWKRGIDTEIFSPYKRDRNIIRQLTGNDKSTIIFASRLVWEKNLETLFDIYNLLQDSAVQVNLLVVGDGTAMQTCRERMPNALFTGKIDHQYLSVLYASADVFLFPSVSETYGNVVIEAMASGLPCVIADGGGSKDIIEQGVNGFKCNPFDAACYVDKIELILNNPKLYLQLVAEGLKVSRQLSWERLAQTYFEDISSIAINSSHTALIPL
jgi:glycosyltransferase involved in cell wall biosynthesis